MDFFKIILFGFVLFCWQSLANGQSHLGSDLRKTDRQLELRNGEFEGRSSVSEQATKARSVESSKFSKPSDETKPKVAASPQPSRNTESPQNPSGPDKSPVISIDNLKLVWGYRFPQFRGHSTGCARGGGTVEIIDGLLHAWCLNNRNAKQIVEATISLTGVLESLCTKLSSLLYVYAPSNFSKSLDGEFQPYQIRGRYFRWDSQDVPRIARSNIYDFTTQLVWVFYIRGLKQREASYPIIAAYSLVNP